MPRPAVRIVVEILYREPDVNHSCMSRAPTLVQLGGQLRHRVDGFLARGPHLAGEGHVLAYVEDHPNTVEVQPPPGNEPGQMDLPALPGNRGQHDPERACARRNTAPLSAGRPVQRLDLHDDRPR